jgi:hypothetical protein
MIFLSYRRDDSGGHVGRLYDALSARFGTERLFVDIDHISPGQDFVQVVDEAVTKCAILLVVIGKRWAGQTRGKKRRIDDPGDFVRLEVAGGLRRQGLRLIPVLVGGAVMPGPAELPDDIRELSRRNAFELSDTRWKEDVARLIAELERALGPSKPPTPARAIPIPSLPKGIATTLPAGWPRWAPWAAGGAALVIVALIIRAIAGHGGSPAATPATVSVSAPTQLAVAPEPPKAIPAGIPAAAQGILDQARRWRADAFLTQITARLSSSGSSGGAGPYGMEYVFRSKIDGAGYSISTGGQATGGGSTKRLPAVGGAALTPLPVTFIDLPAATQTARDSGLVGDLTRATVSAGYSGRVGQPTWQLSGSASDHPFYVDAATGKLLHGSYHLPAGSSSSTSSHGQNPIQALKGLFKKH